MFDALKYVTNPLTLIAFLSIILFYYLRNRNKKQVDLLKEGDAGKKNEALQILLDRYQIDSSNLTPQQKYQLIMEQVRRRDTKFKWAIGASIVLGIVGSVIFFMVNATNKLTDLGNHAAGQVDQQLTNPGNDNSLKGETTIPDGNEPEQVNEPQVSSNNGLSWHENSSQGYSVQYNRSHWNVEDDGAAGYGQPSTGFQNKQYPNDIAVTITINAVNSTDFQTFSESAGSLVMMMGMKVTEISHSQQFISASGFNTTINKMNIARLYYSPSRSMAVDILYSKSLEGSQQLKEAVAMMKSARFQ